jgi:hypothetical protein
MSTHVEIKTHLWYTSSQIAKHQSYRNKKKNNYFLFVLKRIIVMQTVVREPKDKYRNPITNI